SCNYDYGYTYSFDYGNGYTATITENLTSDFSYEITCSDNRYSYAMNNPMKYTDPSGEIFGIDDAIIVAIMMSAAMNVCMQGMSGHINSGGDFWKAAGIGALAGLAGYGAGSLISKVIPSIGLINGGINGATVGFAGGFVGGAGNAWVNGSNFEQGLNAGFVGGSLGALTGGAIGAVSGGITAYKHGGNVLTGKNSIFESVSTTTIDPTKPVVIGEDMEYSNEYAQGFSDAHLKEYSKGVTNLYADGSMPEGYQKVGDHVQNIKTKEYVNGVTKYLGIGKGSNVYLYKNSFTSPWKLYITMGHEYVHAGLNGMGFDGIDFQEAYAYKWSNTQAHYVGITEYESQAAKYAGFLDERYSADIINSVFPKYLHNAPVWYLLKK
ncbi:MAG: hypothetical protein FWD60_14210, partial [Candidatus Azobacteroides sp.]|nr:hypothetical protein [Candidatus Azobacteroides sp.]